MVNAQTSSSTVFAILLFTSLLLLPSYASSMRPYRFVASTKDKKGSPLLPYDPLTSSFALSDPLPACFPAETSAAAFNELFFTRGAGFVLTLCPAATYFLDRTLVFTASGQEICTLGYPKNETRAPLVVDGSTDPVDGMSTAIAGVGFNSTKIRNIQINGNRINPSGYASSGLIEVGGTGNGLVSRRGKWRGANLNASELTLSCCLPLHRSRSSLLSTRMELYAYLRGKPRLLFCYDHEQVSRFELFDKRSRVALLRLKLISFLLSFSSFFQRHRTMWTCFSWWSVGRWSKYARAQISKRRLTRLSSSFSKDLFELQDFSRREQYDRRSY